MANGSERSVIVAAAVHFLREAARVTVSFACVFVTYLVSDIPNGVEADSSDPLAVHAHSGAPRDPARPMAPGAASRVAADSLWSQALGIRKQFVVYLPPSYDANSTRRFPVAYYLHGMWGDEWNWVRAGSIDRTLDSLVAAGLPEMIVVMPDGDDGWYTTWNNLGNNAECRRSRPPGRQNEAVDAYCVPWPKYDDYIARDLVARVDSAYRTIASPSARAIAGLSMGGYGAISLALAYPDVFSAAASHSGVVSPLYMAPHPYATPSRYATNEAELRQNAENLWSAMVLAFGRDTTGWWPRNPGRRAARAVATDRARMPALMLDVGASDKYADQSRDLHATLQRLGVPHGYAEWPGGHDWNFWRARARVCSGSAAASAGRGDDALLPRNTLEWKNFEEPAAFRRFSMVIWEMALVTGVLFRLYRALSMTVGPTNSWLYFGSTFALGMLFVLGMATLHLGNFPLKAWLWRAPTFGALEAAAESLTSLGLILAHREPIGSERAHLHDWVEIAAGTFFWRIVAVSVFAVLLAGVVQSVRYFLLRRENRLHTAVAVHDDIAKHPQGGA